MSKQKLFTSESVTEGHPDKVCDQISDAVLDAVLAQDPAAHVACETCATTGMVLVMGELSTSCYVDIPALARSVVRDIGYNGAHAGFDGNSIAVLTAIDEQSPDIAMGVNSAVEHRSGGGDAFDTIGAGDQGMMFGFACRETDELMPAPITYAHNLTRALAAARKSGTLPFLLPDGKSQVTVQYGEDGRPQRISTVVVSTQHTPDVKLETLREAVIETVIRPSLPKRLLDADTRFFINPTGRFVIGGPQGDSGLTGRKIIVDTYGGYARHGGGAFSGKDPTKVDRSAAYMARYVAKNIVAAGLAERCELELAYAIGVAHPVSVLVDSFGTGVLDDEKLAEIALRHFDMRPAAMIEQLGLRRPIYRQTAAYGHMGRPDLDLPWERCDKAEELKQYVKSK
ncbi:MAG: methionine adenosyltransferase [Clostridia bacterium]|nr:methionine adenosyltransferase [Clostridia bacterium]